MARVLRGRDPDGRAVALKLVSSARASHRRALLEEARVLGALDLPGVVALRGSGEGPAGAWLALELVPGQPAHRWLAAAPSPDRREEVALALVHTLAGLHGAGVVHGDLKLANVVVGEEGPVLVDFGLARWGARFGRRAPGPGLGGGTPGWWAPEQRAGLVDSRTDTFALGRLLDELLPPSRSPALCALLHDLRQLHPDHRPPHVVTVARRLAALLGRSLPPLPPAWPLPPPSTGREGLVARVEALLGAGRSVALVGLPGVGRSHVLARLAATDRALLWTSGGAVDRGLVGELRGLGPCRLLVDGLDPYSAGAALIEELAEAEDDVQVVVVANVSPSWAEAVLVPPLGPTAMGALVDAALLPGAPPEAREHGIEAAAGRPGWLAAALAEAVEGGALQLGADGSWVARGAAQQAPWRQRSRALSPAGRRLLARLGRLASPSSAGLVEAVARLPPVSAGQAELEAAGWLWCDDEGRLRFPTARARAWAAALPLELPLEALHRCAADHTEGEARAAHLLAAGEGQAAAQLWSDVADRAVNDGHLDTAERALRAALEAVGTAPSPLRFSVLRRLAFRVVRVGGSPGEAVPLLEEAIALAQALGRPELEGQALRRLGMVAQYTGDLERARRCLERARERARAGGDPVEAAYALADRGLVAHGTHDWPRARALLEQALGELDGLPEEAGDGRLRRNRAVYRGSLGFCLFLLGQLDAADNALVAATEQLRLHAGPMERVPVLANHARVRRALGDLDGSAAICREAVRVAARCGSPLRESQARVQLAETCMALGRLAEADQELAAAWALARPLGSRTGEVYLWGRTGDLRWQQDRTADARAAYAEALACSTAADQEADAALCRVRIASCDRRLGHREAAQEGLATVRRMHERLPLPPGTLVELLCEEGLADRAQGRACLEAAQRLAAPLAALEPHAEELLWTLEEAVEAGPGGDLSP